MSVWFAMAIEAKVKVQDRLSLKKIITNALSPYDHVYSEVSELIDCFHVYQINVRVSMDGEHCFKIASNINNLLKQNCCRHTLEINGVLLY